LDFFSTVANSFVSSDYCEKMKADLMDTGIVMLHQGRNPIYKKLVLVSGDQGTIFIKELASTRKRGGRGQQQQEHANS
jgi:hypothetical protein